MCNFTVTKPANSAPDIASGHFLAFNKTLSIINCLIGISRYNFFDAQPILQFDFLAKFCQNALFGAKVVCRVNGDDSVEAETAEIGTPKQTPPPLKNRPGERRQGSSKSGRFVAPIMNTALLRLQWHESSSVKN